METNINLLSHLSTDVYCIYDWEVFLVYFSKSKYGGELNIKSIFLSICTFSKTSLIKTNLCEFFVSANSFHFYLYL